MGKNSDEGICRKNALRVYGIGTDYPHARVSRKPHNKANPTATIIPNTGDGYPTWIFPRTFIITF